MPLDREKTAGINHTPQPHERGAVLLTILLLVAVLSTVAVTMMDTTRVSIRQAAVVQEYNQAQWLALSAEEFARALLAQSAMIDRNRTTRDEPWAQAPVRFAAEGGTLEGRISDRANCFNLNSVVEQAGRREYEADPAAIALYGRLLTALGVPEQLHGELTASLVDWIDTGGTPRPRGAEDYHYGGLNPPYRTGNTLLTEVEALYAIRGYTPELVAYLRPYVCALPTADWSALNVNTLLPEQAPLLTMLLGEAVDPLTARRVIEGRPARGYGSVQEFWDEPTFANLQLDDDTRARVALKTRYFDFTVQVRFNETDVTLGTLFDVPNDGSPKLVRRRFGTPD